MQDNKDIEENNSSENSEEITNSKLDETTKTDEAEKTEEDDDSKSKHKIEGKHRLPYDSIFKGKKEDLTEDDIIEIPKQESFNFDVGSSYYDENQSPSEYNRVKKLREEIYTIVVENLKLNIKSSRRKPGRVDFNNYMDVLINNLDMVRNSHSEVFIEFAYYFSDNIVNMFKLLDKKWGGKISNELADRSRINLDDIDF